MHPMVVVLAFIMVCAGLLVVVQLARNARPEKVCATCHTVAKPVLRNKGTFVVELILWCLFIVPGIIYTVWRLSGLVESCPSCAKETMIPADSPAGKKLLDRAS